MGRFRPSSAIFGAVAGLVSRHVPRRSPKMGPDEPNGEKEAQPERISLLSSTLLRVNSSLDLDTVLQEVVDSARALTGARYGVITTVGDSGEPQDFVTSGFTPDEHQSLAQWADGPRLFAHLRDLPGVLRLRDLPSYARALGYSPELLRSNTFMGAPMRHRGAHIANFFLAEKEGDREFTNQDEDILMLFGSQAATAIANARTHREEQRVRAGLEALIETSPVGVVVFDARTGCPVSSNREAKRIVAGLGIPGRPPEELLEGVTYRRGDGREIALDEFPLARTLSGAEVVRAEEIVLSVPDGRSVTTLVNATPIRSAGDAVESVVVTMQDLAPLEELERLRAEFLGLVSHELRVPLTSIKGSAATMLSASPVPETAEMLQFFRIIEQQADHMRALIGDLLDAGRIEAGTLSVSPEPVELARLVDQARDTFLSGGGRHTILLDLPPNLPLVAADRQRIVQVLTNLLANAARSAPDSSPIRIAASRNGVHVAISVSDEGRGVPPDLLPHVFRKHAGLADGGRERGPARAGLGLAICKGLVEAHGGRIWAESGGRGQGARFSFTVPVAEEARRIVPEGAARTRSVAEEREQSPILVVDDDSHTLRYVRDALARAGYTPIVTGDPREVPRLLETKKPILVLLGLLLSGADGIELLARIPALGDLPVIFISDYGRDETIAAALEAGAADYIVKPFSPTELVARVRAALRRRAEPESFVMGDLAISYEQRRVTLGGRAVPVTLTEYELLRVLSLNAGRISTQETLLRRVWGDRDSAGPKLLRTFMKKLRRKLGDDVTNPRYLFTERGVGYRLGRPGLEGAPTEAPRLLAPTPTRPVVQATE